MTTLHKNFRKIRMLNEISSYGSIITEKRDNASYITTFTQTSYTTFDTKHLNTVFIGPLFTRVVCYDKYMDELVVCTDSLICVCERGEIVRSVGYAELGVSRAKMVVCLADCAVILADDNEIITIGYDLSVRRRTALAGAYLMKRVGAKNKLVMLCTNRAVLCRIDSGEVVCTYELHYKATCMFVCGYTCVIGTSTGLVTLLCLKTGEFVKMAQFDVQVRDVCADLESGMVAVCDVKGVLHFYDVKTGVVVDRMVDVCRVEWVDEFWVVTRVNNGGYLRDSGENDLMMWAGNDSGGVIERNGSKDDVVNDRLVGRVIEGGCAAGKDSFVNDKRVDNKNERVVGNGLQAIKENCNRNGDVFVTGTLLNESLAYADKPPVDLFKIDLELYKSENYKLVLSKCRRTFGERIVGLGNYTRRNMVLVGERGAFNVGYYRDEHSFRFKMQRMVSGWTEFNKIRYYDIKDRIIIGTACSISELDHTNKREMVVFRTYNERILCMALSECSNFVIFSLGNVVICLNLTSSLIYKRIYLKNVIGVAMSLFRDRILLYDGCKVHFYRINGLKLYEMVVEGTQFVTMVLIENVLVMRYAKKVVLIDIENQSLVDEILFNDEIRDMCISSDFKRVGLVFERYAAVYELGSNSLIDKFNGTYDRILFSLHNEFVVLSNYNMVELYADENWFCNERMVDKVFLDDNKHNVRDDDGLVQEENDNLMIEVLSYLEFERKKN
ncbi:putative WD40/YVTN repeat-like-containing domain, WD40 repeat-like-containing domain protein [Trachipleistophora hominis]|uniref:Putative WD40/YVTN repeat-like-containing domain, WD40 repeat-like-containing domain protein n=1 Tax=Trachipleistophora hominis TaxID=72359 RepID=L7JWT9_TRAHO|nr:putative WD40/YVTN repeat-like-containing domain, WD40 repeat-like-containing domain protein [Trachipleistophora hominis]